MNEVLLKQKKTGMLVLLLVIVLYILGIAGCIFGGITAEKGGSAVMLIVSIIIVAFTWLLIPGLKVLKPQEALVLTLFGKYIGTLKGEGFYFVNPFCTAVNPAAKTKLNQSGDVKSIRPFANRHSDKCRGGKQKAFPENNDA